MNHHKKHITTHRNTKTECLEKPLCKNDENKRMLRFLWFEKEKKNFVFFLITNATLSSACFSFSMICTGKSENSIFNFRFFCANIWKQEIEWKQHEILVMKTESDIKHALSIFYISTPPPPKMTTLYQSGRFKQEAAFFHRCVWRLVCHRNKCFENSVTIHKKINDLL